MGPVAPPSPLLTLILGPPKWPFLTPLAGGQKSPFWGPCGAESGGGGGAPPTTLILLRNQWRCAPVSPSLPAAGTPRAGDRSGPALASRSAKNSKKILFFFEEGCVCFGVDEWGCGNRLRRCGRRRRAGPPPPPLPEVCDARGGALTGPVPSRWRFSRHNLRGAAGGTPGLGPRLALANGLAPLAPATPLRGTAVPCFEGGALPHGYVPPTRAEEARAGPVAAMLPNRADPCRACCAW